MTHSRRGAPYRPARIFNALRRCKDVFLTLLFATITAALVGAAIGSPRLATGLTGAAMILALGVYAYHASDSLPLSF